VTKARRQRSSDRSASITSTEARDKAEAEATKYSGHSVRVGFYVAASEAGAPPQHIAAIAPHKTLNMARRYSEKANMLKNAPHRLPGVGV
jgi:hypothetical protein